MAKSKNKHKHNNNILHFSIIKAAASGDSIALSLVVEHYDRLIMHYSRRHVYSDDFGHREYIDEVLRSDIECKLINKTVGFSFKPAE